MTAFITGLLLGGLLGAAVLSWCVAGKQTFDRVDVFMEGWKSGFHARGDMDVVEAEMDVTPLFRSIERQAVDQLITETGGKP